MPRQIKVLVIDDDPAQCETLADILSDFNCDVAPCSDPLRAEELARASHFDLVLLDLKLGSMSGIELLRHIRPLGHDCIIVLTGMIQLDVKRAAMAEGADAVMDKPVDIPRLLEIAQDIQRNGDCKASALLVPAP
jgi:DNA-binding response OmpR family regulator